MRALGVAAEGLSALGARKLRAFFMMAGTIVGIAALVVIMAVGKGTERKVMKRVNNWGPRAIMLISGGGKDLPPPDMTVTTLTLEDADAVREEVDDLELVSPMVWKLYTTIKHEAAQLRSVVWGVEPNWHRAYDWYVSYGEGITAEDVATLSRVCLIGRTVREELFGEEDPLGKRIYLNNVGLVVKGVLEERGTSPGGGDFDNKLVLPITTAMRRVLNVDYLGAVRLITAKPSLLSRQAEDIRELIHNRHHITPPQEDDFRIITPLIIAGMARGISRTLYILLLVLACLSLIVGGVVMMNILLVSVGARTAEIGLRRSLGATRTDIFLQFLTESLSVTLLGMLLGCLLGWTVCLVLANTTQISLVLSWQPYAVSVVFALLIGTFFGVQPARLAARLHPVEALR
ncbi:MAG: ABC transporter permease [Candidatus Glassbacteria bacterium]|nr:ABC transporter permease [Candidatus Glassbacteria bacterium]